MFAQDVKEQWKRLKKHMINWLINFLKYNNKIDIAKARELAQHRLHTTKYEDLCMQRDNMALTKGQRSLRAWTKQKWRTKSGKPSTQGSEATGERYLPEKAIKALSASEYSSSSAAKRKAKRAGKQVSKQPKKIAKKTSRFRKFS